MTRATSTHSAGVEPKSAAINAGGLIDKREVAALLGFSRRTIDNFLQQGLPHMRFGKRRTRFDAAEVLAWCKEKFGTRRIGLNAPKSANTSKA